MRIAAVLTLAIAWLAMSSAILAVEPKSELRAGMIGLDTSHVVEFASALNQQGERKDDLGGVRVVAAYPGGSPDMPLSWNRVQGFTEKVRGMGIDIVDSIEELLQRVDVVLLESVDGRVHLAQARPVIAAGKPLFIDKPIADSLANAAEIFRLAESNHVPCFSASSLRYSSGFQAARQGTSPQGVVHNCTAWSPANLNPDHAEPFWLHGIHGVETLFTILGPQCQTVTRVAPDRVRGVWRDGRQGTFLVKDGYGATAEGSLGSGDLGKYEGYRPLLVEIVKFFKTGVPPVAAEETLEIMAFMEAADESMRQQGAPVSIQSMMEKAHAHPH